MKLSEEKYNKYALVREMMETPAIISALNLKLQHGLQKL